MNNGTCSKLTISVYGPGQFVVLKVSVLRDVSSYVPVTTLSGVPYDDDDDDDDDDLCFTATFVHMVG